MPRTPSDSNSRGPKSRPSGARDQAPRKSAAPRGGAEAGPRRPFGAARFEDGIPTFDDLPEKPAPRRAAAGAGGFAAKPAEGGAKRFGAKMAGKSGATFSRDEERGEGPRGAKPQGKSGPRPGASRDGGKPFGKGPGRGASVSAPRGPRPAPMLEAKAPDTPERIAKAMSRGGVASRRDAEKMILEGRVAVNGQVIDSPALTVTAKDRITIDGHTLAAPEPPRLWLYHKPEGLVTSARDELGRPTVFDDLPEDMPRVMSVGRLDLTSEGLLLLTNDGELKRKLELPSTGWLRKYRVRVNGRPLDTDFEPLRQGIVLDGEVFAPMIVALDRQQGANAWLTVAIREGRNREIRRTMEAVGYQVNRLIRTSYGPFQLGDLKPGEVSEVRPRLLRDQLGMTETPGEEAETEVYRQTDRGVRGTSRTLSRAPAARSGSKTAQLRAVREAAEQQRSPYAPRSGSAERGERPVYPKPRAAETERDDRPAPRAERGERPAYGKTRSAEAARGQAPRSERGERPSYGKTRSAEADRGQAPRGAAGTGRFEGKRPTAAPASAERAKPALTRGGARVEAEAPRPAWAKAEAPRRGAPGAKGPGGKPGFGKPTGKPAGKPAGGPRPFEGGKPKGAPPRKR